MSVFLDEKTGKWYFYGRYPKGHPKAGRWYKKRGFTTPKRAEKAEKEFRANWLDEKNNVIPTITFQELIKEFMVYQQKKVKESTTKSDKHIYRKINGRIGHIHLSNINKKLLQEYIDELDQTYSKNYVERIYYAIQKALSYAKFKGYIQANYIKQVEISARKDEIKKDIEYWELDEFETFINSVDEIQWKTIFIVFYWMGIRRGELMGLSPSDIDMKEKTMRIHYQYSVKTLKRTTPKSKNSIRTITMPDEVVKQLEIYIARLKAFGTYDETSTSLYLFGGVLPISATTFDRRLKYYINQVNKNEQLITPITLHGFRHSHASYLINNMKDNYSIYDIAKRLGDTVNTILSTYAHWFKGADRKMVDMINNIQGKEKPVRQAKNDDYERLKMLKELYDTGILTDDEFTAKKKQILNI